jgi:hypothetical protein
MATALAIAPVLRVVPEAQLQAQERTAADQKAKAEQSLTDMQATQLAGYIRQQFDLMRRHRNSIAGWSERLLEAQRTFNGHYDSTKLAQIRQFGGSEVYARVVATKCRGATSLLRDVYLGFDRPWGIAPAADPDVPDDVSAKISQLVTMETASLDQGGQPVELSAIRDRIGMLMDEAKQAAKKQAVKRAKAVEDKIEELLDDGGFYKALAEFLVDVPQFPFACIKGPIIKIVPSVKWAEGKAQLVQKPKMFWMRVSPFDLFWTPGVSDIEDASVIERNRYTRADLNDLLDLPGYNVAEIRAVLDEYGRGGLADDWDSTDSERAVGENRENPRYNQSGLINCLEFHGNVQGRMLIEYGLEVDDPMRDYMVQAWLIGSHVIKCMLSPSPRKRHSYYITSFEKVPGTPVGHGLPDILADIQDVMNATLRTLVNNMSIASGPQVVVNDERLAADEDGENLFPWKRWHVKNDPFGGNSQVPVSFFQPTSNAQELLSVYKEFNNIADELSAIPKYMSGSSQVGGAGRTSSGLAMLMGNASKMLQTVAANIDRDVIEPCLTSLFELVMLTDATGLLSGEEEVRVLGVNVAVQRETERSRQLEFLQTTANPIDSQIMGAKGRSVVLRAVSKTIGLDGEKVVPSEEDMESMEKAQQLQQQQQQQQQQAMAAQQGPPGPGGIHPQAAAQAQGGQQGSNTTQDVGPRYNAQQRRPAPVSGGVG